MIPFDEWKPDSPDLGDGARIASGVIPEKEGYRPFKGLATTSTALTARAQGAAWFRAPDGGTHNASGDETHLYLLDEDQIWQDVTRLDATQNISGITQANPGVVTYAGADPANGDRLYISGVVGMTEVNGLRATVANVNAGANTFELEGIDTTGYTAYSSGGTIQVVLDYDTDATANWRFAQFQDAAYATNGSDDLQVFDLGGGTEWEDASGTPPTAKYIGVVRTFLVLANTSNSPQEVIWSGDNNPNTWTASATTLSDAQTLPDGGEITGFAGGEFGRVYQEAAIQRMSFEGSPTIFRFDKVATDLGCTIPNSLASWGSLDFFCHRSGFHMLAGGAQIVPIGRGRFDRWFWGMVDQGNLHRVSAAIDPLNSLYMAAFPTGDSGTPAMILIYNWKADRAAYAEVSCEIIYSGATQQSWTLEDLNVYGSVEAIPFSLDSSYWAGNRQLLLAGFYTDHKSGTFSGANLAAQIDTREFQPTPGKRSRVRAIRPMVDGGTPTMALGYRDRLQDVVQWSSTKQANGDGIVPFNISGRYFRGRLMEPAGSEFQWLQGVDDVDARPMGFR